MAEQLRTGIAIQYSSGGGWRSGLIPNKQFQTAWFQGVAGILQKPSLILQAFYPTTASISRLVLGSSKELLPVNCSTVTLQVLQIPEALLKGISSANWRETAGLCQGAKQKPIHRPRLARQAEESGQAPCGAVSGERETDTSKKPRSKKRERTKHEKSSVVNGSILVEKGRVTYIMNGPHSIASHPAAAARR